MENYAALIFDVVDSRKLDNRMKVQEIIKNVISYLNKSYKNEIKKEVICGAGDEFQGLFNSISSAFSFARKLQLYIYPIRIRCGIGYGSLKYYVDDWMSTEIDGEAYYNARDALKNIPNKGTDTIFFKTNILDDKFINTFSAVNAKVKIKESSMARLIDFLIDFYCPINNIVKNYNDEDYDMLKMVMIHHFTRTNTIMRLKPVFEKTSNAREELDIDIGLVKEQLKNGPFIEKYDNDYIYEDNIPWGISKLIAEFLHTSPQNINQHINLRGIRDSRSIDSAILNTIVTVEGGLNR